MMKAKQRNRRLMIATLFERQPMLRSRLSLRFYGVLTDYLAKCRFAADLESEPFLLHKVTRTSLPTVPS